MNSSRRDFLRGSLLVAGASVFSASALSKVAFAGAPELKLIDEKDPVATALKYHHDGSKVDAKMRVDKMGVKAKDQKCSGCALYTKEGMIAKDEVGKCTMLTGRGDVKANGWCSAWAKKA